MSPPRLLLAALVLAASPLLGCARESMVGLVDSRDQELVLADADIAQCPSEIEGIVHPATCGYPASYGRAVGKAQLRNTDNSDRPNTKGQIEFGYQIDPKDTVRFTTEGGLADTLPLGFLRYRSVGDPKSTSDDLMFQGGDPFVFQVVLDSENTSIPQTTGTVLLRADVGGPGDIYAEGPVTMNGDSGWFFCMFARDNHGIGRREDRVDIRFWGGGTSVAARPQQGPSCRQPTYRFVGVVVNGDIDAQEGQGGP